MEKIAQRIRNRRIELKMSQDELAEHVGYKSRSSINKIEKDARNLPQTKIIQLAEALKVTPGYLMGWEQSLEEELVDQLQGEAQQIDSQFKYQDFMKRIHELDLSINNVGWLTTVANSSYPKGEYEPVNTPIYNELNDIINELETEELEKLLEHAKLLKTARVNKN